MKATKYQDRIFTTECNNCRALLNYQSLDILYNNVSIEIPHYTLNNIGEIVSVDRTKTTEIKDNRPYVLCPICNNKHFI